MASSGQPACRRPSSAACIPSCRPCWPTRRRKTNWRRSAFRSGPAKAPRSSPAMWLTNSRTGAGRSSRPASGQNEARHQRSTRQAHLPICPPLPTSTPPCTLPSAPSRNRSAPPSGASAPPLMPTTGCAPTREGGFPEAFHRALADAGWLGIAMPEAYGGAGLGIGEAALMMHTIAATGAGLSGASAVHMNIFGLHPVVVFGTDAQKARWLPALIQGRDKACFGVTEPDTGLNTLKLKTRAVRQGDHYLVHGQKLWISTAQVANKILLLARTTPVEECSGTQG